MKLLVVCLCLLATSVFGGIVKRTTNESECEPCTQLPDKIKNCSDLSSIKLPDKIFVDINVALGILSDVSANNVHANGLNNSQPCNTSKSEDGKTITVELETEIEIIADIEVKITLLQVLGSLCANVNLKLFVVIDLATGLVVKAYVALDNILKLTILLDVSLLTDLTDSCTKWIENDVVSQLTNVVNDILCGL